MENTKIEYSDHTANPIKVKNSKAFYCTKVSPGCKHCYAEVMSRRLAAMGGTTFYPYKVMDTPPELELRRDMIQGWARRKKPEKIFVTSMTDVFGEFVPDTWVYEILDGMVAAHMQTFQVFTKRHKRMRELVNAYCSLRGIDILPANICLIVTVEDQQRANERIPELINTKCSVRGLSCEPLLGRVDIEKYLPYLNWVIVGGESGWHARPMHPDWARSLRDQCKEHNVPFFFKQWGEWAPLEEDAQPPFWRWHDGTTIDGHALPSIEEMESSKSWDNGMWCIAENEKPCIFKRVGKGKNTKMLDAVYHTDMPVCRV